MAPAVYNNYLFRQAIICALITVISGAVSPSILEKMRRVAMDENDFEKVHQLHYGWYIQAVNALLGAMGKEEYMKMDRNNRRAFVACLDNIEKEYDLQSGAKCLVKAFDHKLVASYPYALHRPYYDFIEKDVNSSEKKRKSDLIRKVVKDIARSRAARLLRLNFTKRSMLPAWKNVASKQRNEIKQILAVDSIDFKGASTLNSVTDSAESVRGRRMRRSSLFLRHNKDMIEKMGETGRSNSSSYGPVNMAAPPALIVSQKTPIKMMSDVLRAIWRQTNNKTNAGSTNILSKLGELQYHLMEKQRAASFKRRMLDMVVGENKLRREKNFTERFRDLMPEGSIDESIYGLVDAISRHTKDVNPQLLSPRFFPLLPSKYSPSKAHKWTELSMLNLLNAEQIYHALTAQASLTEGTARNGEVKKPLLSPDLFSLYKDKNGNSVLSIPEVLEKSGLSLGDRETLIELIMDISGANEVVDQSINLLKNMKRVGLDRDLISITEALDEVFKNLSKSIDGKQKRELSRRKFSFLTRDQLLMMYGEEGMLNLTTADLPFNIDEITSLNNSKREELLRNTIRLLAADTDVLDRRHKRQTLEVFKHITLSPYTFSPTLLTKRERIVMADIHAACLSMFRRWCVFHPQFNVLGPIVLSPSLFSPEILSPRLLSPPVLSPSLGNPLIISPFVLGPNTLSPQVFAVYVLTPYVLSPNVFNPFLLSPLILSPYILSPELVSPTLLSGVVLSPYAFSPAFFTQSALSLNILSPSFLS